MAAPTAVPPPADVPDPSFATPAWLRTDAVPATGVLSLHDGRLSFATADQVVFDEPFPGGVPVDFPWYRFGGEMRVVARGRRHRVALTPPHGAPDADDVADAADGRRAGRIWRTLLAD